VSEQPPPDGAQGVCPNRLHPPDVDDEDSAGTAFEVRRKFTMTNRRTSGYCSDLPLQERSLQINASDLVIPGRPQCSTPA
jgi:hypothetical protein